MKSYSGKMALLGMILGLGAPIGYVFFSYFVDNPNHLNIWSWFLYLLENETHLILYLTIPTMLVFVLFGYFLGRQSQKLELMNFQMDDFLHIASHDISSPLGTLRASVEYFVSMVEESLEVAPRKILGIIEKQTNIAMSLLEELLDVRKFEAGGYSLQLAPLYAKDIIERAATEVSGQIEAKKIKVNIDYQLSDDVNILGDESRLRQVVRNLLTNAVK